VSIIAISKDTGKPQKTPFDLSAIFGPTGTEKRNQVWRKIMEAQHEHKTFLDRLGFAEAQAIRARFIDPIPQETFRGHGSKFTDGHSIPWRNNDPATATTVGMANGGVSERRKIFESFQRVSNKVYSGPSPAFNVSRHYYITKSVLFFVTSVQAGLELPDSNQAIPNQVQPSIKDHQQPRLHYFNAHNKRHVSYKLFREDDNGIITVRKPVSKFLNTQAKVDSGLNQMRFSKANQSYYQGQTFKNSIPGQGQAGTNGVPLPLTPAPKLPADVGVPHSIIPNFVVEKTGPPVADPYGKLSSYEKFRRGRAQRMREMTDRLYSTSKSSFGTGGSSYYRGVPAMQLQLKDVLQMRVNNKGKTADSIRSNPVQILKAAKTMNPIESTQMMANQPKFLSENPNRPVASQKLTEQPNTSPRVVAAKTVTTKVPTGQAQRRYRPSQLLPRHVPGPKYDNIFIENYTNRSEPGRDTAADLEDQKAHGSDKAAPARKQNSNKRK
jgi:hypothetical protein